MAPWVLPLSSIALRFLRPAFLTAPSPFGRGRVFPKVQISNTRDPRIYLVLTQRFPVSIQCVVVSNFQ